MVMVLLLLGIFYQDIRSRAVYWVFFPLLALAFVLQRLLVGQTPQMVAFESAFPAAFLLIQLLVLSIYFSLKQKRFVNITESLLGPGDILFLFCLCLYFPAINFIAFYIVSLFAIIAGWLTISHIRQQKGTIPLAGLQAAFVLLLIGFGINPANENWFYTFIKPYYAV
ncbi:hypothetical protein BC343_11885 [Mucilaginibacter pedocola]|uniref:Prepilin type IV endopeptidase peptidase domain-containing protein n=2 Tax=Mucilaginibacter pedocola TaxID=1792845 RepID=A0A1S9PBZ5_9SPHI|nr:hypothetical protein BC343_11885 [Mucilaginibacter pedocola]